MKSIKTSIFIMILLFLSFINCNVFALNSDDIHSREALLVNINTDEVLFSKNTTDESVGIASLTKIMTYAVVIDEIGDLENTKIKVPEGLVQEMVNKNASRAALIDNYEYTALDLLYGMMVPSGCDAAETLARYIGNGDASIFVEKMNNKAKSLGMNNTHYVDSYGIGTATEDNTSTEQDLYKLIKYVYNLPYFKQIISTEYYEITGEKDGEVDYEIVRNTNYLMGEYNGGEYYYPYSIGGKTGNLDISGKCLMTIAKKGDLEVVAITLGVPYEYGSKYDYNLRDNITLLESVFNKKEDITIDLGYEYRSVEIGKMIKIDAITSAYTNIKWTSSNPEVATVDQEGIVRGISQGQVKITAETETGNIDYTYVSVNFYNGVHTKYSTGEKNEDGTYNPIDYSILKNKGFDYVIVRAGYGPYNTDGNFYTNIENAIASGMNIGIWFEGYAETIEEATNEAKNLISILSQVNNRNKIQLPIFYNLFYSPSTAPEELYEVATTFNKLLNEAGYTVILELGKTKLSTMNLEELKNNNIDLSVIYRTLPPDYTKTMIVNDTPAAFWNYKSNAYLGNNFTSNGMLSLMYMNYKKIDTLHKEYIIEDNTNNNESKKDDNNIDKTSNNEEIIYRAVYYTTSSNNNSYELSEDISNNDSDNSKNKDKLNIQVSSINNKKTDDKKNTTNNKLKEKKEEEKKSNFIYYIIIIALGGLLIFVIYDINTNE